MPVSKPGGRWEWTRGEDEIVQALRVAGVSADRTADAIGCEPRSLIARYGDVFGAPRTETHERAFTENEVKTAVEMKAHGIAERHIAKVLETSITTLRKHLGDKLAVAEANLVHEVARALAVKAKKGDTKAMMFFLEKRGGAAWRDRTHVVHEGVGVLVPPGMLTADAWIASHSPTALEGGGARPILDVEPDAVRDGEDAPEEVARLPRREVDAA